MTKKIYLADSSVLRSEAIVVDIIYGEKPVVRLDHTVFHAQGGGQKADRGRIGSAIVLHVAHSEGQVDHLVDNVNGVEIGQRIELEIDGPWRLLNSVYHTAGHLIAGVVEKLYPTLSAVSGHQWPGEARVEFACTVAPREMDLQQVNHAVKEALIANLPVSIIGDPYANRAIRIGELPAIPCGGTHVRMLAEIEAIRIHAVKSKGGRLRMSYEADPAS